MLICGFWIVAEVQSPNGEAPEMSNGGTDSPRGEEPPPTHKRPTSLAPKRRDPEEEVKIIRPPSPIAVPSNKTDFGIFTINMKYSNNLTDSYIYKTITTKTTEKLMIASI